MTSAKVPVMEANEREAALVRAAVREFLRRMYLVVVQQLLEAAEAVRDAAEAVR